MRRKGEEEDEGGGGDAKEGVERGKKAEEVCNRLLHVSSRHL